MSKFDFSAQILHGCDYNPDQWLDRPDVLKQDISLMKKAGINVVTLGVFSWASLEPQEGVYTFEWLDEIMNQMDANGIKVILSTVSGGKPPWLVKKHPDMMRMNENRVRLLYGDRENQCNSHPVYLGKVRQLDEMLAKRYAHHPALILWHISNEIYGTCHCPRCQKLFQEWLREKYGTIEEVNRQWWTGFWSHRYTSFSEIESPSPVGEMSVHGLALDYWRFYSELSVKLVEMEIATVRAFSEAIPVTTNMFHMDCGVDYHELAKPLDITSWDSYPKWHSEESEWGEAVKAAFTFDYCRCLNKGQPFLLMESTPSTVNNAIACKLKRPKMHMLSAMQAVAFGANSVQYFQWRKSRGAYEKFHGAVVSHGGGENTRVFQDVAQVGRQLSEMAAIAKENVKSPVAILFDQDNMRALREQKSLKRFKKDFEQVIFKHYEALLKNYVSVDIISRKDDFSQYDAVIAPVMYICPDEKKIRSFVENGGRFVSTFYSGLVNENDLVFEGIPPHGLNDVFGLEAEETDALYDHEYNTVTFEGTTYRAEDYCDVIPHYQAEVLAAYEKDFYRGLPAVTRNAYGKGFAYYIGFNATVDFLQAFYGKMPVSKLIDSPFVDNVMVSKRGEHLFLMNFGTEERTIEGIALEGYECKVEATK